MINTLGGHSPPLTNTNSLSFINIFLMSVGLMVALLSKAENGADMLSVLDSITAPIIEF